MKFWLVSLFFHFVVTNILFAKNYYKENANDELGYCSYNSDNDSDCDVDNQVFDYELGYLNNFDINSTNIDEWFPGTASIIIDEGYIENPSEVNLDNQEDDPSYQLLMIPKHSVVQIKNNGLKVSLSSKQLRRYLKNMVDTRLSDL